MLSVVLEHVSCLLDWPNDTSGENVAFEGMQLEFEIRDDAEITAAAANGPEQVGIFFFTGPANLAVGSDYFG